MFGMGNLAHVKENMMIHQAVSILDTSLEPPCQTHRHTYNRCRLWRNSVSVGGLIKN